MATHSTSKGQVTSLASARREIDDKIAECLASSDYKQARQLKTSRNLLAPISVLPPELLSQIFVLGSRSRIVDIYSSASVLPWVRVSWVSTYWRAVALDSPALWSIPVLRFPRWAEEMLERSKDSALYVWSNKRIDTGPHRKNHHTYLVRRCLENVNRLRELHLAFLSTNSMSKLLSGVTQPAPILRSLALSNLRGPGRVSAHHDIELVLSETMFGGHTPQLESLILDGCGFPLRSALYAGLVHLEIRPFTPLDPPPSLPDLLRIFSSMPMVQHVELRDCLPEAPSCIPLQLEAEVVHLRNLDCLILSSSTNDRAPAHVINHLIFPSNTKVLMGGINPGDDVPVVTIDSIMPTVSRLCHTQSGERKGVYKLHCNGEIAEGLAAWFDYPSTTRRCDDTPDFVLSADGIDIPAEIVWPTLNLFQLEHLQSLEISLCIAPEEWLGVFGNLTSLSNIKIIHFLRMFDTAGSFIGALKHSLLPIDGSSSIEFPALRTIELVDVVFDRADGAKVDDWCLCLRERARLGAPIENLLLRDCWGLSTNCVRGLREHVGNVLSNDIEDKLLSEIAYSSFQ